VKELILAMYSGGLDSLGMLYVLLTDPRYESYKVHVHHVDIYNLENRTEAERQAVEKTLKLLRERFSFEYSNSMIGFHAFNGQFLYDTDVTNFMSGYICSTSAQTKYVAFGKTLDDAVDDRLVRSAKIFSAFTQAEKIYPVGSLSKQEIYDLLPPELRASAWSCRTPVYSQGKPIACGKCKTCVAMSKIVKICQD